MDQDRLVDEVASAMVQSDSLPNAVTYKIENKEGRVSFKPLHLSNVLTPNMQIWTFLTFQLVDTTVMMSDVAHTRLLANKHTRDPRDFPKAIAEVCVCIS